MILFVRNKGEKQYHQARGGQTPHINPKNGWRKGMKFTTWFGETFIIDAIDAEKKYGELRIHATRIK